MNSIKAIEYLKKLKKTQQPKKIFKKTLGFYQPWV